MKGLMTAVPAINTSRGSVLTLVVMHCLASSVDVRASPPHEFPELSAGESGARPEGSNQSEWPECQ
ncbi:hypothetical protein Aau02nite_09000 [Amorphoplanes auranticolor]|uniref:Uncharacterized protein n=1 Tax=Actinoplanes auranticolor TaxID=47988 RepID=A0A919S5C3_9ACTN|nr:hypothetical protein Aau02nite_09000 [Actinoplanes auranticolor]